MTARHTADTITDDALDQLYAELGQLYKENAAAVTALADMARKRNEQMDRADRAEAELRARAEADSADATAGSYAHRAEHAEAALARVRKLIADDPSGIFSDDEIRTALGDQP